MTLFDDRGRVVIVKPWEWVSEDEKIDRLRSLSTARCFSYRRLEMRSGAPRRRFRRAISAPEC